MNRLILIGNGFDLAHGRKTSYMDFIFHYIKDCFIKAAKTSVYEDPLITVKKQRFGNVQDIMDVTELDQFSIYKALHPNTGSFDQVQHQNGLKPFLFETKSTFFENLLTKCKDHRWVDIENEYYGYLKECLKPHSSVHSLRQLNSSFSYLIQRLREYLSQLENFYTIQQYFPIFGSKIKRSDIAKFDPGGDQIPEKSLIVNFNYTATMEAYSLTEKIGIQSEPIDINYIHGNIMDPKEPIIFGFGDEIDKHYKDLEDSDMKGVLTYMKSFGYFRNSNYHNLVRFISSADYQVYVLGHSCGRSDRTLLNMIFENQRCLSIKIFFHQNGERDNYTDITEELSRHFIDKVAMRNKIVPRSLSEPMPQYMLR